MVRGILVFVVSFLVGVVFLAATTIGLDPINVGIVAVFSVVAVVFDRHMETHSELAE